MAVISVEEVQSRAQAALTSSPFYELRELQVEWRDEALVLSGCVSSFYHKQLAQEVVRSVCRDSDVINSVYVEHQEEEDVP
jgi:osmotically-inducible protein OsmY